MNNIILIIKKEFINNPLKFHNVNMMNEDTLWMSLVSDGFNIKRSWLKRLIENGINDKKDIISHFLISDISETSESFSILEQRESEFIEIRDKLVLQIDEIVDISSTKSDRISLLQSSKRTLKMLLRSGNFSVIGIEKRKICFLDPTIEPGSKVMLQPPVHMRYGVLFLTDSNTAFLGGCSEIMRVRREQMYLANPPINHLTVPDNVNHDNSGVLLTNSGMVNTPSPEPPLIAVNTNGYNDNFTERHVSQRKFLISTDSDVLEDYDDNETISAEITNDSQGYYDYTQRNDSAHRYLSSDSPVEYLDSDEVIHYDSTDNVMNLIDALATTPEKNKLYRVNARVKYLIDISIVGGEFIAICCIEGDDSLVDVQIEHNTMFQYFGCTANDFISQSEDEKNQTILVIQEILQEVPSPLLIMDMGLDVEPRFSLKI